MTAPQIDKIAESVGWGMIFLSASVLIGWWVLALAVGVELIRGTRA